MKKAFTLITIVLITTVASAQIRVTPEGYPVMPKKPSETTLSDNDSIMAQKDDGIVRNISVGNFKSMLSVGPSTNFIKVTPTEYLALTPTELAENDYMIVDSNASASTDYMYESVYDVDGDGLVDGIDTLSIYNYNIRNGEISQNKLADNSVGTNQIIARSVLGDNIATYSVMPRNLNSVQSSIGASEDGYILSFDNSTTEFEWIDPSTLPGGGSGDMIKAEYDTDDDGVVDDANSLNGMVSSSSATANTIVRRDANAMFSTLSDPYSASWDGDLNVTNKNDVYDKIESLVFGDMLKSVYDSNDNGNIDDIEDNIVTTTKLVDNAVTGSKILNGTVTSDELASNAVVSSKIANGTIQEVDISTSFYEEGTFTPTVFAVTSDTYSVTSPVGRYTRIGNLVFIDIEFYPVTGSGTGALIVGGLPFSSAYTQVLGGIRLAGVSTDFYSVVGSITGSEIGFIVQQNFDPSINESLIDQTLSSATIYISGTYVTN